jgi:hypothetical protein
MAYDRSEPKTGLITGLSVFVVVSVVLVRYGLVSYYDMMHDTETSVKVATRGIWQLNELRASAQQRLSGGAMPIDQAMAAIAQGQRPSAVSPRASTDTSAITGWMQNSQPLPREMPLTEPPPPPPPVDPATLGDGGAPVVGDGGAAVAVPAVVNPATVQALVNPSPTAPPSVHPVNATPTPAGAPAH